MSEALLRLTGISKSFGAANALSEVDFDVQPGEIHVLAGENGAGKSTLVKIIGGAITRYVGQLELDGSPVRLKSPQDAAAKGISVIHQEFSLIPGMSIADNLFLGSYPSKGGFVERPAMRSAARGLLDRVGVEAGADARVSSLSLALRQLVEIAKALRHEARVLLFDEPTSALNSVEAEKLFGLLAELKTNGAGIVYISHKMDEIERLADRITVLRDGRKVITAPAEEIPPRRLVELMAGDKLVAEGAAAEPIGIGEEAMTVSGLSVRLRGKMAAQDVSLSVRKGEVVGLAGLEGSGASVVLNSLFGSYGAPASGEVSLEGRHVRVRSPRQAIGEGIALLTNNRKESGLVLSLSVSANLTLCEMANERAAGWRNQRRERAAATRMTKSFGIRCSSLEVPVGALSGGNQQKVALAKLAEVKPRVFLLDEPTRGIDVGAKQEIYRLIAGWKQDGMAILLITSELPELLQLSDRIYVMHRGRVSAHLERGEATAELVLEAAMGR